MTTNLRRRQLGRAIVGLTGLSVLTACGGPPWSAAARRVARVGFIGETESWFEAFRAGLRDAGWTEGRNVTVERRAPAGKNERFPEFVQEFMGMPVDVIVVTGPTGAVAARDETSTIPIVAINIYILELGLADSLARPGGNLTGVSLNTGTSATKNLELLRQILPGLDRVAVLVNSTIPGAMVNFEQVRTAAIALGMEALAADMGTRDDLDGAFDAARRWNAGAVLISNVAGSARYGSGLALREAWATQAIQARVSLIGGSREVVDAGGLLAYTPNTPDLYRRGAGYVDRILRGASPADLPIEQPTSFEVALNMKTAEELGLTIPPEVAVQVTAWVR